VREPTRPPATCAARLPQVFVHQHAGGQGGGHLHARAAGGGHARCGPPADQVRAGVSGAAGCWGPVGRAPSRLQLRARNWSRANLRPNIIIQPVPPRPSSPPASRPLQWSQPCPTEHANMSNCGSSSHMDSPLPPIQKNMQGPAGAHQRA